MKEHEFTCNTAFHSPITAARCRCRVTGCASSLRSSYLSRWGALLPRPLIVSSVFALRKREGFGGEKAAGSAASLPVPTNLNISLSFSASSHASANALQAASRSKNVKLFFRRKAGRHFTLLRIFLPGRPTAPLPIDRPVPGTGTLPDAGGVGSGGYAPHIPPSAKRQP